jgi:class 3 adenylate cyclase
MICPRCGTEVPNISKFCGDCGAPLPWRCGDCGSENPPGKRFCSVCGTAVTGEQTEAPGPVGRPAEKRAVDRRQLTVMFVDMVGSTALGARVDPEDLREVIAAFHNCVTGLVVRFGGFVARYMGDGLLIYFGYPQSNEDDAERAIHAGLSIVEAVGRLGTIAGPQGTLKVRVGIATGVVVVGDLIGFGSSLESAVVGETANLAARLQAAAQPGMIVIDGTTHRLTGGLFDYRDLGPTNLKGLSAPVHTWAVLGESVIESRFEALRSTQAVLVGRAEEIALLERRWNQAKAGEGKVVLLSGEPGVGKSHLVAALEQKLAGVHKIRLRFVCSPHHKDSPLHPIIGQLERAADFRHDDTPTVKRHKLGLLLGPASTSDTDIVLFADLLSVPGAADDLPKALTPRKRKEMSFAAILRHLGRLAKEAPVLAVFEDIHWADPTTRELLDIMVETIERLPILLMITTRPDMRPSWVIRPQVTAQLLGSLAHRDAVSLIGKVAGDRDLPESVIERILLHADGVPLFIEELTRAVLELGASGKDSDRLAPTNPLSPDAVPISLQASMMARLDRLTDGKEVAQIGSVIGRQFSFEMLRILCGLPPKRLEDALAQLVQTGLASMRGHPPDSTYSFGHALLQDAAYASLLRDRRRALHLRVAEVLEEGNIDGSATEPQLIAWHFGEGGAAEKSIDLYLKAAERATGRSALAERVSHLQNALQRRTGLPDSETTLRLELSIQLALGQALIDNLGSGSDSVRDAFQHARDLCLALDDTEQLLRAHDGLINFHLTRSESEALLRCAEEMAEVGQRTGNPQAILPGRRAAGYAHLLLGQLTDACEDFAAILAVYEVERDGPRSAVTTRDSRVSVTTALGICLTALGKVAAGTAVSMEGVTHAERLGHIPSLVLGLRRACVQRMMWRDAAGTLGLAERLIEVSADYETFLGPREGMLFCNWAKMRLRHDLTLLRPIRDSLDGLTAARHSVLLPFFLTCAAEAHGDAGDPAGAAGLLAQAAGLVERTGERWSEAEVLRLQARFVAREPAEAVSLLRRALAVGRAQGARLWELRAALDLARLAERGLVDAQSTASTVLGPVLAGYEDSVETSDLVAARALLSGEESKAS